MSYVTLERTMREYQQRVTETSTLVARLIANYSLEPVIMGNYSSLRSVLSDVLESNHDVVVIEVLDQEGVPRVSAYRPPVQQARPASQELLVDPEATPQAPRDDTGREIKERKGGNWPEVTSPIVAYSKTWGYVRLRCSLDGFNRAVAAARLQIFGLAAVSSMLSLLVAGLISRAIVTPIRKLVSHARSISRGNLDTPIEVQSRDEIGFLAMTLERMRVGLRQFLSSVARRAMSFEGDLNLLGLPRVLTLVRMGMRTGGLVLEKGSTAGVVYFQDGDIVDAALGEQSGEEALYAFFKWRGGTFKFSPRLVPERTTIRAGWSALILEGVRRVNERAVFEQVIHSPGFVPSRSRLADGIATPSDGMTLQESLLNRNEVEVLSLVDGRRSVQEIARLLGKSAFDVYPFLYRLVAIGLVRGDEDTPSTEEPIVEQSPDKRPSTRCKVIPFPTRQAREAERG
ncbi:MAG: DUF4388 domain-containing protein [Bacillota bacterium]